MEEINQEWFLNQAKIEAYPKHQTGGQTVGMSPRGVRLICPETDFQVTVSYERSMIKNRDICVKLYKEFLKEIGCNN